PAGGRDGESPRHDATWRTVAYAAGAAALVLAAALAYITLAPASRRADVPAAEQPIRVTVSPPANTRLSAVQLALSPDGGSLAYVGLSGLQRELWIFSPAAGESHRVRGVDDATSPLWSPDGRPLGFVTRSDTLMRRGAAGGPPQRLAPAGHFSSGSWNEQ